jgi:Skp family chaperone for outer membrane proteins
MRVNRSFVSVLMVMVGVGCFRIALGADAPLPDAPAGGTKVAVVDLDRTARELGWMTGMQKDLEDCGKQLQADMKKFGALYNDQLKAVARPGDGANGPATAPSPEFARESAAARQQMLQLRQKADQLFAGYRASLIARYRQALLPTVQQVAHDRKAELVLVKNDTVLLMEKPVDITDAVIDAARANPPEVPAIPIPRLGGPAEIEAPATPATQPSPKP